MPGLPLALGSPRHAHGRWAVQRNAWVLAHISPPPPGHPDSLMDSCCLALDAVWPHLLPLLSFRPVLAPPSPSTCFFLLTG